MSQAGILSDNSGPGADIETITGNSGGAVGPDGSFNINFTASGGFAVTGTAGSNLLNLAPSGFTAGSVIFASSATAFSQDNANFFWDDSNNRLGLGTASPQFGLDLQNPTTTSTHSITGYGGSQGRVILRGANGIQSAFTATTTGQILGFVLFSGASANNTFTTASSVSTAAVAAENFSSTASGSYLTFATTPLTTNTRTERLRIGSEGGLYVGAATNPLNLLDVPGGVAIGTYAGVNTAPSNGLIVSGQAGFGVTSFTSVNNTIESSSSGVNQIVFSSTSVTAGQGTEIQLNMSGPVADRNYFAIKNERQAASGNLVLFKRRTDAFGSAANLMAFNLANDNIGVLTITPQNAFDISGASAIGSYAGVSAAPSNGLIVSGNVGIGTSVVSNQLDVFNPGTGVTGTVRIRGGTVASTSNIGRLILSTLGGGGGEVYGQIDSKFNASFNDYGIELTPQVSATGYFSIPTGTISFGAADPASVAKVNITSTAAIAANITGTTVTVNGSSHQFGLYLNQTYGPTSGAALCYGAALFATFAPPNAQTITVGSGLTVSNSFSSTGTLTTAAGIIIAGAAAGTATITNHYGLFVNAPSGGGTSNTATFTENLAVGSYTANTPPSGGAIISGNVSIGSSTNTYKLQVTGGEIAAMTLGNGFRVAEGSNARMGTATMNGGTPATVVVNTTAVTANSRILITGQTLGTIAVGAGYSVSARTASTSFTITSSAATDTSIVAWTIFEPA